jgi:FkbM family methyltransferase
MYIDVQLMKSLVIKLGVRGIFHLGANTCQELGLYVNDFRIPAHKIVWVEAIPTLVEHMKRKGVVNMYSAVLDEAPGDVVFNIASNNGESSSLLDFNTHSRYYPSIVMSQRIVLKAQTLQNFVSSNVLPDGCLDFLVMDIQGAELRVLRGSPSVLQNVKMICTEVNAEEVYKGAGLFTDLTAFLEEHGFVCVSSVVNEQKWGDALYVKKELLN